MSEEKPDPTEWRRGPPPHVGWWNASASRDPKVWRWWDGNRWSLPVGENRSSEYAAQRVKAIPFVTTNGIKWRHHYPENARVPRINPENLQ